MARLFFGFLITPGVEMIDGLLQGAQRRGRPGAVGWFGWHRASPGVRSSPKEAVIQRSSRAVRCLWPYGLRIAVTSPAPPWTLTSKPTLSPTFTAPVTAGVVLKVMVMAGQFTSGI